MCVLFPLSSVYLVSSDAGAQRGAAAAAGDAAALPYDTQIFVF